MVSIDFCKAFVGLHNGKVLKKPTKSYLSIQKIQCNFTKALAPL